MRSRHRWVEHTGELELALEAPTPEALFVQAQAALAELLSEHEPAEAASPGEPVEAEIAVSAPDRATLLAEWLSELAFRAESEGLVPLGTERLVLGEADLEALVRMRPGSPPHLVKAVTYHRLGMWSEEGAWRARVILDV